MYNYRYKKLTNFVIRLQKYLEQKSNVMTVTK